MDAMSGRGELGDRDLVADFYGLGGRAEYRTGRTGADRTDWWIGGRSALRNPRRNRRGGLVDWRTGWTTESWKARTGVDGADWGGRGGRGGGGRMGRRGVYGADWEDRLGCVRLGRLAALCLRAKGIPGVLSPDADCEVIWLHTPGIHIRFFRAHVVVIFLGTHTSKAQRASTGEKFFGSLGALNITYSMFIQMGHAIHDVVIVTYKGGLSSLIPPSPLCTSCCS